MPRHPQFPSRNTITACVKKNGQINIIGENFKTEDCKKPDSLLSWNITGPQGPKGDTGPQGPAGTPGTSTVIKPTLIVRTATTTFDHSNNDDRGATASATCNPGEILVGGGFSLSAGGVIHIAQAEIQMINNQPTWVVSDAEGEAGLSGTITADAHCLSYPSN